MLVGETMYITLEVFNISMTILKPIVNVILRITIKHNSNYRITAYLVCLI